jgi:hypothetical protein
MVVGIAISGVSGTALGQWQYLRAGKTWQDLPSIPKGQAFLLSGGDQIRFLPSGKGLGTASLTAHAWDGGGMGGKDGGTAAVKGSDFSNTTLLATCLVNTAPVLSD